jgi:hypothetical protein
MDSSLSTSLNPLNEGGRGLLDALLCRFVGPYWRGFDVWDIENALPQAGSSRAVVPDLEPPSMSTRKKN